MNIQDLPIDLIIDIISRLPAKSVARCRCVSKLWASKLILGCPYFTELFLTRSKTRPRLLFFFQRNDGNWWLYSSPQPQISYTDPKSSLSVTANFVMSFPKAWSLQISPLVSSLICCPNMEVYDNRKYPVICNPNTGHLLWLPRVRARGNAVRSYMGYASIDKQFKVLYISYTSPFLQAKPSNFQILNLESAERLLWRKLECPLQHCPLHLETFINGILYYIASFGLEIPNKIACFEFNWEEFKFIDEPWLNQPNILVNYKGKLCGITMKWIVESNLELSLWVLEDIEKQEWSTHSYFLWLDQLWETTRMREDDVFVIGMTLRGDIVLSLTYTSNPFYVYFFNPDKDSLERVEIKGFEGVKSSRSQGFVEYVEDLKLLRF